MEGIIMKQVVFNALQTSLSGGIGRYSYELAKTIYKQHAVDFIIVVREEDLKLYDFANKDNLIIVKSIENSKDRNFYEQFVLPKLIHNIYPNAIIHYPDTMAPLLAKNKVVITIHDLAFKSVKGSFTVMTTLWKNFITHLSVRKANKIIAITSFVKDEILKYYNLNIDKIDIIYNGFNNFGKQTINYDNISNIIINYGKKNYILTVSTISPRKNIDGLIKAFNLIKEELDYNLIVVGKNGWLYESVVNLVNDLNLKDRVIFTGAVNDDELKFLYKNSNVFIYPSFYEGFGLPPLEAMSYGIPCIVSNTTCIPEVVGNAAVLVNPYNIEEIKNEIINIANIDSEYKNIISKKSMEQIKKYSWEKSANQVINLYDNL